MKFPFSLPLLLDGATGTNLLERGMPRNVCVEEWICQNPSILQQLQKEFIDAGAQAIYAPTFGANRACLARYGLEDKVEEFNRKLVALSKQVAKPKNILVGGSLCPTGLFVPPHGEADFDDIYEIYREQIRVLDEAEVDFFIIETQTSLADMRAAVLAARSTNLPVFVTITVDKNGQTATGGTLLPIMITLQSMGVDAIGLNCSFGPEDMTEFINDIAQHSRVPIIAKPNAGLPSHYNGGNGYLSPDEFSYRMESLMEAGATIIGGCCGTTPEHIAALRGMLQNRQDDFYHSELETADIDDYAAAIESESFFLSDHLTYSEPIECSVSLGDDFIDLDDERSNVALVEINSMDDALLLAEYGHMSRLPIAVRAESLPILDAALRYFQGRLLIDSECCIEPEALDTIAAKYGAIVY